MILGDEKSLLYCFHEIFSVMARDKILFESGNLDSRFERERKNIKKKTFNIRKQRDLVKRKEIIKSHRATYARW